MKSLKDQIIPFLKQSFEKRGLHWQPRQLCSAFTRHPSCLGVEDASMFWVQLVFPPWLPTEDFLPWLQLHKLAHSHLSTSCVFPFWCNVFTVSQSGDTFMLCSSEASEPVQAPLHLWNPSSISPNPNWLCPPPPSQCDDPSHLGAYHTTSIIIPLYIQVYTSLSLSSCVS